MDRVFQSNADATEPMPPSPGARGFVQSDCPLPSFTPTTPGPWFFDYVTESFRKVIVGAGMTPDPQNLHQLADAVAWFAQNGAAH